MRAKLNGFAARALEGDKKSNVTTPPTEAAMPAKADIFRKFRRDNSAVMRRSRASCFSFIIVSSSSMVRYEKVFCFRERLGSCPIPPILAEHSITPTIDFASDHPLPLPPLLNRALATPQI